MEITNKVAQRLQLYLETKAARVYRNRPATGAAYPYIVFNIRGADDSYPSTDYIVYVDVFSSNDQTTGIAAIEDLADQIDAGLNHQTLDSSFVSTQWERSNRQSENSQAVAGNQMIDLQYSVRTYLK